MASSSSSIPSINVPLTNKDGRINPIWHEFFRSFIANTVETTTADVITVTAGAGLSGGGELSADISLTAVAGNGISTSADDISIDIAGQAEVRAEVDDEFLIADR